MDIIESVQEMSRITRELRKAGQTIGFIPTMGFLHEGHLSLVREAKKKENDRVVVSIFVNPTQFGPGEDYEQYPRDLEGDAEKLRAIGIDYIFSPEVADMYPEGYNLKTSKNFSSGCGAGTFHMNINPYGDVTACGILTDEEWSVETLEKIG